MISAQERYRRALIEAFWRKKDLSYLLHSDQEYVDQQWKSRRPRKYYLNCSRRWGKSRFMAKTAIERALSIEYADIRYAAPTQKQARNIVEPHIRQILRDCPDDLRPDFRAQEQVWRFPNGSTIILAGVDNGGAERLRGTSTHLGILDEAGLMDDLDYIIKDILLPQTITVDGQLIIASTPPKTPAHPYNRLCQAGVIEGTYICRTIYDAPHITDDMRDEYARESGGVKSTTWRREYLAEFVTDENSVVIPEWQAVRKSCIVSHPFPPHFFTYVVSDVGFTDLTVVGFFYVDFLRGKLVQFDELVLVRTKSSDINGKIYQKFHEHGLLKRHPVDQTDWNVRAFRESEKWPKAFIADTLAKNTIADMSDDWISWSPPFKHNPEAALNMLRMGIARQHIEIHERCKVTISHLDNGIWNKTRTSFERSDEWGHFDAIDMLKYAYRSIPLLDAESPYPEAQLPSLDSHHVRGTIRKIDPVEEIFGRVSDGRRRF